MDLALAIEHLISEAQYSDASSYERLQRTWTDARVLPTLPELEQAWADWQTLQQAALDKRNDLQQKEQSAKVAAGKIPGWATWTEQQLLDWVNTNISSTQIDAVTNLTEAKGILNKQSTAIVAMARMILAMRSKLWPDLGA